MKRGSIFLVLLCAAMPNGLLCAPAIVTPSDFVNGLFKDAHSQIDAARKQITDKAALIKKICLIYGMAIAQVIQKATLEPANKDALVNTLYTQMVPIFNVKADAQNVSTAQQDNGEKVVGQAFDQYADIPGSYALAFADILTKIKTIYGSNVITRQVMLQATHDYIKILLNEKATVNKAFEGKSLNDAINTVLTQELKDKTAVESRMIVNLLFDKLIEKTGATFSQKESDEHGKAITQATVDMFASAQATTIDGLATIVQNIASQGASKETLFIQLTAARHVLLHAVTPTPIPLPLAQEWQPPRSCKWYDLSCSIPWNSIGAGLKDVFQDKVGGGLKTAFVDNVYEKGLKSVGEGFETLGSLIKGSVDKVRTMAHTIRDAMRSIADTLSSTPNVITHGAMPLIGTDLTVPIPYNTNCVVSSDDPTMIVCTNVNTVPGNKNAAQIINQCYLSDDPQKALAKAFPTNTANNDNSAVVSSEDTATETIHLDSPTKQTAQRTLRTLCTPTHACKPDTEFSKLDAKLECTTIDTRPKASDGRSCVRVLDCVRPIVPNLSQSIGNGAHTIALQVDQIRSSIEAVKKQKQDITDLKLDKKGLAELKTVNALLLGSPTEHGALDDVIEALQDLVGTNCVCTKGALCALYNAFITASIIAGTDQQTVRNNIAELDQKINNPSIGDALTTESLPSRLRDFAKDFDI